MLTASKIRGVVENIGLLSRNQIDAAVKEQMLKGGFIKKVLSDLGYLKESGSSVSLLSQIGITPTPMALSEISADIIEKVASSFAREHHVVPIEFDGETLALATDEPLNYLVADNLKVFLNVNKLKLEITDSDSIKAFLDKFYGLEKEDFFSILGKVDKGYTREIDDENLVKFDIPQKEQKEIADAPVIRLANAIITDALRKRSSDIHVEPLEDRCRIRYRIDGILHETISPSRNLQGPLIARLKLMAGMDLAEKRLPQDGRIMVRASGRQIDLRVSSLPGIYGESIVMRILDKTTMLLNMNQLGFLADDEAKWNELLRYSGGIVLVTGPTGSGKTTTLYTSLSSLNTTDCKIMTVEEPVEYQIEGINQTPVRVEIGLTFSVILRSFLRQAPDVILVGEIRDSETADIALRAALTGHLVFSTLHTNDATAAATRLVDLGAAPFLVASSLQGVMAQRLVRILCPSCKIHEQPTESEKELLRIGPDEKVDICRPGGCNNCNNTGFRSRKGIFEIFLVNDEIRQLILRKAPSSEIRLAARRTGMRTMGEDGLLKVKKGITTYEEVISATGLD
ncbi:MAG: GspE/PulE family protein [Candidatus Ratteibacteria bacterium]|jgi:type II secretory ATPase GspE/PulE/Tfp pilus assembly ATPase PilB-like protein